jgi:hypothetical protein
MSVVITVTAVVTVAAATLHGVLVEATVESHGRGSLEESFSPGLNQRTSKRIGIHDVEGVGSAAAERNARRSGWGMACAPLVNENAQTRGKTKVRH